MPLRNPLTQFIQAFFGDYPDNYTEFESDGTMVAVGDATMWKDELGPLLASRLESVASDIQQNLAEGSITFESTARFPDDYVILNLQINHDWELEADLKFHIHWWQTSSAMPNWLMQYRYQRNGAAKTTAWSTNAWQSSAFTYSAGTLCQITGFGNIVIPAGVGIGNIVQVRLYRDYTNVSTVFAGAETSGLDVEVVSADIHKKINTVGSRAEYTK